MANVKVTAKRLDNHAGITIRERLSSSEELKLREDNSGEIKIFSSFLSATVLFA